MSDLEKITATCGVLTLFFSVLIYGSIAVAWKYTIVIVILLLSCFGATVLGGVVLLLMAIWRSK